MNKVSLTFRSLFLAVVLTACQQIRPTPSQASSLPAKQVAGSDKTTVPQIAVDGKFTLTSPDLPPDGRLPVEYTCDGGSSTLALNWSGEPAGTTNFALMMHHVAGPDDIHWYWILYNIPASVHSLQKNVSGIGTLGNNINNGRPEYSPPCSKGPGDKEYVFTVYALSAEPQFSVPSEKVDRAALLAAIQNITLGSAELRTIYARAGLTVPNQPANQAAGGNGPQGRGGGVPPAEAIAACVGKSEQSSCDFMDQNGEHAGVCETIQNQLACSPQRGSDAPNNFTPGDPNPSQGDQTAGNQTAYNIEQAVSDKAQGMTISYDALAFMTGDLGADSFFPPGKVADFWGFQFLRDNDASQMGHAGDFLTSAALNTLNNLTADQRAQLVSLAGSQVSQINEYGYRRFVLIKAFNRLLENDLPSGTSGLSRDAVKSYSTELYKLDGEISFARAELYGKIINSLTNDQKAYFDAMKGKGMKTWPAVQEPEDIRGLDRDVKVAVMTYAADLFSWYAGSVDADVYFCPERHGTYFGSFYLKDIKAMSDPTYAIPTNLTGDLGQTMVDMLNPDQAQLITGLVDIQKDPLNGIVETRRAISIELRKFLSGGAGDKAVVLKLMEQYGAYDGEIIYSLAVNFSKVGQSLSEEQKSQLTALRSELLGDQSHASGAYLYSQPIPMPEIPNTDFLFQ